MDSQQNLNVTDWSNADVKFHYFVVNGRGAIVRAILSSKNVPFVDNKLTFEDWALVKFSGDFEFGQLPMLEVNGQKFAQSGAITLYLARQLGLLGTNSNEEYLHTSLLFNLEDIFPSFIPAVFAMTEEGRANIETKKAEFLAKVPAFLAIHEKRFQQHGGRYSVGDTFSLSDIILTVILHIIFRHSSRRETWEPILVEHAPLLAKLTETISQNELAEYFAKYFINEAPL